MNSRNAWRAAVWSLALALLTLMPIAFAASPDRGLLPDVGSQAEIRSAVHGLTESRTEDQRQAAVETVSDLGRRPTADRTHLLEQIAIFLAGAGGTEEAMGGAILLRVLDFQRDEILAATLPHMVAASPGLNKVLREIAATTMTAATGTEDPVSVVLEIEAWRATATGVVPDATQRAEIGSLLSDLAQEDNRWVRAYAAAVVATDPELVAPDVRRLLREE